MVEVLAQARTASQSHPLQSRRQRDRHNEDKMTEVMIAIGAAGGCAFILQLMIDSYYTHRLKEHDRKHERRP
jgi:hypothetical protein